MQPAGKRNLILETDPEKEQMERHESVLEALSGSPTNRGNRMHLNKSHRRILNDYISGPMTGPSIIAKNGGVMPISYNANLNLSLDDRFYNGEQ